MGALAEWRAGRAELRARPGSPLARPPALGLALDIETTGLDPNTDRIIELAVCPIVDAKPLHPNGTFVKPEGKFDISKEASAVHGITKGKLKNAPSFREAWTYLMEWLANVAAPVVGDPRKTPLVAHNAGFDRTFILRAGRQALEAGTEIGGTDVWLTPDAEWVDTLWMARRDHPDMRSFGLDQLAHRCGVPIPAGRHRATTDAELLAECVRHWPAPGTTTAGSDLFAQLA